MNHLLCYPGPGFKRALCLCLAALFTALTLAGCAGEPDSQPPVSSQGSAPEESREESSSQDVSASASQTAPGTIPTLDPAVVTLYMCRTVVTYSGDEEIQDTLYLPVEREIPPEGLTPEVFSGMLFQAALLALPEDSVTDVTVEGETALVTLRELPDPESLDTTLLDTVAMTLLQNCPVKGVSFQDQQGNVPSFQTAQEDPTRYTPPTLAVPEQSREELAALRQSVSYEDAMEKTRRQEEAFIRQLEANGETYVQGVPLDAWNIRRDETAKEIADFIEDVTLFNIPSENFETIQNAPADFILMASILNSPAVYGQGEDTENAPVYPELLPVMEIAMDYECFLQEHVEATARRIFGDDVPFAHTGRGISPWKYHEYAGVYTPPHMGWGAEKSYLLEYSQDGDIITATVAYSSQFTGLGEPDPEAAAMTEEEWVTTREPRCQFTLRRRPDGRLILTGYRAL